MSELLALLLAAAAHDPSADYHLLNPKAIELFERDPVLMEWALRKFDSNADGDLSIREADGAAIEFKRLADGDSDGQVTPTEYRGAREFVIARWAVSDPT